MNVVLEKVKMTTKQIETLCVLFVIYILRKRKKKLVSTLFGISLEIHLLSVN